MSLVIPNLDDVSKKDPKLGEALRQIQNYSNLNITPAAGNKQAPPGFVTPGQPQG